MFNIGMMELLLILLVAFLIVGPKDLPKVARWIARMVKKARSYVDQFRDELGLDELADEMKGVKTEIEGAVQSADVSSELRSAQDELRAAAEDVNYEVRRAASDVKQAVDAAERE